MSTASDTSVVAQGLTPAANSVLNLAEDAARSFFHSHIGPEHVLIGLVNFVMSGVGLGAVGLHTPLFDRFNDVCRSCGVTSPQRIITQVERRIVTGRSEEMEGTWKPMQNTLTKRLLQHASMNIRPEGGLIDAEHLFVAILELAQENIATTTLREMGFKEEVVRKALGLRFEETSPSVVRTTMFNELGEGEAFIVLHPEGRLLALLDVFRGDAVVFCVIVTAADTVDESMNAVGFFNSNIKVHIHRDQLVCRCV